MMSVLPLAEEMNWSQSGSTHAVILGAPGISELLGTQATGAVTSCCSSDGGGAAYGPKLSRLIHLCFVPVPTV